MITSGGPRVWDPWFKVSLPFTMLVVLDLKIKPYLLVYVEGETFWKHFGIFFKIDVELQSLFAAVECLKSFRA